VNPRVRRRVREGVNSRAESQTNIRPCILAGSLMVVTLSVGESNVTWML